MATINSPAIAIELQALQPRSFPIDAPVTAFALAAFPPSVYEVPTGVFTVCTLNPTPPSSGDTTGPFLPLPEGFDPDDLPLLDSGDIVDTSPNQIIGCVDILVEGYEQNILNALFPGAVAGDGVVARETEDIWKYDGTIWENVGPSPGPTILPRPVVPLIQYIERYDASIHTRLQIQSLDYALALLTEPDPIGVVLGVGIESVRPVRISNVSTYEIETLSPTFETPYRLEAAVFPVVYTGTGDPLTIGGMPWHPGMVWAKPLSYFTGHVLADSLRGIDKLWRPNATTAEFTDADTIASLNADGFTTNFSGETNLNGETYASWSFAPLAAAVTNTSGTRTSSTRVADFYSVFTYTGNGTAGATIGHGLSGEPQLVIIKGRNVNAGAAAGGSAVGTNNFVLLSSANAVATNNAYIRSADATTVTVGTNSSVNQNNQPYVGYAFRDVPGLCKVGTYVGDGDVAGRFIDCDMRVNFLLVKRMTGGVGDWNVIDSARGLGTEQLLLTGAAQTTVTQFYELLDRGFKAMRGNQVTAHDLNISGSTYMYLALGSYRPTLIPPVSTVEVTPLPPTV
jgi:hypothetical protein